MGVLIVFVVVAFVLVSLIHYTYCSVDAEMENEEKAIEFYRKNNPNTYKWHVDETSSPDNSSWISRTWRDVT